MTSSWRKAIRDGELSRRRFARKSDIPLLWQKDHLGSIIRRCTQLTRPVNWSHYEVTMYLSTSNEHQDIVLLACAGSAAFPKLLLSAHNSLLQMHHHIVYINYTSCCATTRSRIRHGEDSNVFEKGGRRLCLMNSKQAGWICLVVQLGSRRRKIY